MPFASRSFRLHSQEVALKASKLWQKLVKRRTLAPSEGSNSEKSCRSLTARSSAWSSVGSSRAGLRSRRVAWSGTYPKSRNGWPPGGRDRLSAASKSMYDIAASAQLKTRIKFQHRRGRRKHRWRILLPRDPGLHRVGPFLHHVAALYLILRLVIDAAR